MFYHSKNNSLNTKFFIQNFKKFILLLILVISSCEKKYDGDSRLQVEGKVIDENNIPISHQEIKVYANYENSSQNSHQIGVGRTDTQGNYSIYFPRAYDLSYYTIEINREFTNTSSYSDMLLTNIKNENFINYNFQSPEIKLYLKSNLSNLLVTYNKINVNNVIAGVEFIGEICNNHIDINNSSTNFYDIDFRKVKKNQIIELKYTIYNSLTQTSSLHSEFITITDTDSVNYTLNY